MYTAAWRQTVYRFADLKELMAKATPLRSGDVLAGVAAKSAEENVAAKMALADVPLKRFLDELVVPYEDDDVTPPHHRQPRRGGVRARRAHDGRRLPRLAAVARRRRPKCSARLAPGITPEMAAATSQDHAQPGSDPRRAQGRGGDALSRHHRPAGAHGRAPAAEPSDRRQARHRGVDRRRADARLRRRRHRHQSGRRQHGDHHRSAAPCSTTSSGASTSRRRAAC